MKNTALPSRKDIHKKNQRFLINFVNFVDKKYSSFTTTKPWRGYLRLSRLTRYYARATSPSTSTCPYCIRPTWVYSDVISGNSRALVTHFFVKEYRHLKTSTTEHALSYQHLLHDYYLKFFGVQTSSWYSATKRFISIVFSVSISPNIFALRSHSCESRTVTQNTSRRIINNIRAYRSQLNVPSDRFYYVYRCHHKSSTVAGISLTKHVAASR